MKFWILITGEGEGCDYSIGCNQVFKEIEAVDREQAVVKAKELFDHYGGNRGERRIDKIIVIGGNFTVVDIDKIEADRAAEQLQTFKSQREVEDRAEYERLKLRFG